MFGKKYARDFAKATDVGTYKYMHLVKHNHCNSSYIAFIERKINRFVSESVVSENMDSSLKTLFLFSSASVL